MRVSPRFAVGFKKHYVVLAVAAHSNVHASIRVSRLFRRCNSFGGAIVLFSVAWGCFSVVAAGLQWALEAARLMSPMLQTANVWLGAAILVGAGLWQLTPLKTMCLRHCRSPLGFLIGNWRAGRLGALQMGLEHGAYCLGCCWFLMALLFFGGVMNLYWIVGLAVFIMLEKIIPLGHWLGRVAGVVLIGWGAYLPMH